MGQRAKGAGAEDRLMLCALGLERARESERGRERERARERESGGQLVEKFSGRGFLGEHGRVKGEDCHSSLCESKLWRTGRD